MHRKRSEVIGIAVLMALEVIGICLALVDLTCAIAVEQGQMMWKPWW